MNNAGFQELLEEFFLEARERVDEVESLMLRIASGDLAERGTAIAQAKRELHTLKGNSGMMGFSDLQQLAHHLEDEVETLDLEAPELDGILAGVDRMRRELEAVYTSDGDETPEDSTVEDVPAARQASGDGAMGSVRVPFSKIEELVEIQAETLIFRNRLSDAVSRGVALMASSQEYSYDELKARLDTAWESVDEARQALEKTLSSLQDHVTDLGMVPLQGLFRSLGRIVHDESSREGKDVSLLIEGGDTPIDKTLLEAASEVLGHLIRNAVIHGIETPEKRAAAGKRPRGRVRVAASLEGGEVRVDVDDDGAGINLGKLREKARQMAPGLAMDGYDLVFADGLSTQQDADLGSGRGVGMSAVKRGVESHGGRIEVTSVTGRGSRFTIRLPLTTSILHSLLLSVDGEEYALPLASVTESQRLDEIELHKLNHAPVVRWRGKLIPILDLGLAFDTADTIRDDGFFVVINVNGRHRGLAIDDIVGIRDIVVKRLDGIVGQPTGISGSTILGDGRVIMILDPNALGTIPPFVGKMKSTEGPGKGSTGTT